MDVNVPPSTWIALVVGGSQRPHEGEALFLWLCVFLLNIGETNVLPRWILE